ncbi:roadblock/LC7 domain-containing protein [Streptomyces rimosus]|uniref:roadblock/LC7 domain-containing protein n=1 Tax=Streptomyces rimosus TaxID=1927 RepID=UPI0004C8D96C|nr:roadblock/LC7 domain-containing protein [Streptomyces rimosus]
MSPMSQAAQNLNWLITNFVDNTPGVSHTVVVSADGLLLAIGSSLAVLAHPECDIGLVGYEMALLVDRAGTVLTPDLRAELQGSLLN